MHQPQSSHAQSAFVLPGPMADPLAINHGEHTMMCNSWIIVSRATGKPVLETYSPTVVSAVNTQAYEVLTALAWLQRFNASLKN